MDKISSTALYYRQHYLVLQKNGYYLLLENLSVKKKAAVSV
jgi:hypothetical protein